MNLTTSHAWSRPPVGIVRVEVSLFKHLIFEPNTARFGACVWHGGKFVELGNDGILGDHDCLSAGDFLITAGLDWDQPYGEMLYDLSKKRRVRIIACCYDLIPVLFPQYCVGDVAKRFSEYFIKLSWASAGVLCISEQTRSDYLRLCESLGAPIRPTQVIALGDNIPGGDGLVSSEITALTSRPFFLFVSTIERRKNHEVLYRAYHLIRRSRPDLDLPKLIFVGMPGWGVNDLLKDIELDPLTRGLIIQLHHVSDSELAFLYQKALVCFYPSFYEGWGLPVGEALSVGKAVFSSNQGSLPEVGGSLVRYLSPWSPEVWADAIIDVIERPESIETMETAVRSQYEPRSWVSTASQVVSFIDKLAETSLVDSIHLFPGYDMSSFCGIRHGPSIVSGSDGGFLMFGPHMPMASGCYTVSIYGSKQATEKGDVQFDVCVEQGARVLGKGEASWTEALVENSLLCALAVEFSGHVSDLEVRCKVEPGNVIILSRVAIEKIS
jgi:glycosyltransferase involved in cell wall biosynthesis